MKRAGDIFNHITEETVRQAALRAFRKHGHEKAVIRFREDFHANCKVLYDRLKDGSYTGLLSYRELSKVNNNGKRRAIDSPTLVTRIYQVLFLELIEPVYYSKDNHNGLNCKPGCGITSNRKNRSVVHLVKHLFYDRLDLNYAVVVDQRKCYDHITVKAFRKAMRRIVDDHELIDFGVAVSFIEGRLPIGTPTSPIVHHITMLGFDSFIKDIAGFSIRYADDNLVAFSTKEEAQAAKWRIKNFWWYKLGIRAKRQTVIVTPLSQPVDFCGYVFHRNGKAVTSHDKGYTRVRTGTSGRAKATRSNESWPSYFGLMKHADAFNLMASIEKRMKLRELTAKVRINRSMDARSIDVRDLLDMPITIYDYEIRYNGQKQPNWIKCLIGYNEIVDGEVTGKTVAREFHGNYQGIIQFILEAEKAYGKYAILPLEEAEIENQCGYIFKGSTNQLKYIEV